MKNLREIIDGKLSILFEGKDKDGNTFMKVLAPWTQADEKNANGRTYPKTLLQREISKVQEKVKSGAFVGTGDHPSSGNATIADASHVVEKVWLDGGGRGWAELKILPTVKGKNAMTLLKGGARLGLSSRGTGNVSQSGVVQDDFRLMGIDIVPNPAYSGGTFDQSNIFESVNFEEKKEEEKMKKATSEEAIQLLIKKTYELTQKETGTTESFEQWKKNGGEAIVRATIAHSDGKFASVEEALAQMGSPELADELEVSENHIDPKDVQAEAFQMGVNPQEYADMLNKNLAEEQAIRNTGWSESERKFILREAQEAGCDVTTHEGRKKVLDEYVTIDNSPDTLLEAEAIAKHKILSEDDPSLTLDQVREILVRERDKKEKEELKQQKIQFMIGERMAAGFGLEIRPDARKISQKIIDKE